MIAYVVALACAGAGGFLAWHHAIAPLTTVGLFVAVVAVAYAWPRLWLAALPALLPIASFAPWTGSMAVEEIDLLALACAAGAYARMPSRDMQRQDSGERGREPPWHVSIVAITLVFLYALLTAYALYRGVADTGGFRLRWYDGYYEAINSVRIAKGFALALLYWPLLLHAMRASRGRDIDLLAAGLALGAGVTALTVVWERHAFTGLLNFSTDYRATGMFWEMHVGGAALDGYLALTFPFVVWALMRKSSREVAAAGILALLVSYACLATFSRGVYLAVPVSLALLFLLLAPRHGGVAPSRPVARLVKGAIGVAAAAAGSYLVFRAGGYRALFALLGVLGLSLRISSIARGARWVEWVMAAVAAGVLALAGLVAGSHLPKGPYVVYAAAFALCLALMVLGRAVARTAGGRSLWVMATLAGWLWTGFAAVRVAGHWGGEAAQRDAAIVVAMVGLLAIARTRASAPPWPARLREEGIVVASVAVVAGVVAVMMGGAYMTERFSTSEQDLEGRVRHWREGLRLVSTPTEWLAGKGLGRFPKSFYFGAPDNETPGSYSIGIEEGNSFLVLSAPRSPFSFGELFRVAQRVPIMPGTYTLTFDARAGAASELHVEVCEQHLLYNGACAFPSKGITVEAGSWKTHVVTLDGRDLDAGAWYAPRFGFFAFAVAGQGMRIDVDNVSLVGPNGSDLIANGDFVRGMARWFMVSEKTHLPWHIKSLPLNILFDEGLIGLTLFTVLVGGTLFRLLAGRARGHPLSPFIATSIAGFLVVGAFDSLLDVPRVAFAFYLVLFAGLALGAAPRTR